MELKFKTTIQDSIDSEIIRRRLSGIEKRSNLRRRIPYIILLILSSCIFFLSIKAKMHATSTTAGIISLISVINIIFAKQINNYYLKKNAIRNIKIINKQYNYNFLEPIDCNIKIENEFVETEILGTITKYPINEYLRSFTEDRFIFFEFTIGRYIYITKENLSQDLLEKFCKTLESKRERKQWTKK